MTKVATQGRYNSEDRVTTYTLSYSVDGKHWAGYKQHAIDKVVLTKFVNKLSLCFMRSPNRRRTSLFTNIVFVVLINFETNETKESFVKRTSTLLFGTLVSIGDISVSIAIASPQARCVEIKSNRLYFPSDYFLASAVGVLMRPRFSSFNGQTLPQPL